MITNFFTVQGMTCSACSGSVEKLVSSLSGVSFASVNLLTATLTATYDETQISDQEICSAIEGIGFDAFLKLPDTSASPVKEESFISRLLCSLGLLIPLMILSMGPMWGLDLSWFPGGIIGTGWAQFALCLPVLWINRIFFYKGISALIRLNPNMDSLVSIGSAASVISGLVTLFTYDEGHHLPLYFESAAMILALVTLGKYLESRAKKQTGRALDLLKGLIPEEVILVNSEGVETSVPTNSVQVGQLIRITPGQRIPLDGEIIYGTSSIDESSITGESLPIDKSAGDTVTSGSMNLSGAITVRALRVGANTTINQMIQMVEAAAGSKAPIARIADKVSRFFVPAVMLISLLTFVLWLTLFQDISVAINMGISVLVISCPCALGLATPTAIMVGTGLGASRGILFRSAESLELTHTIDTVLLDKTGTITSGTPSVKSVYVSEENSLISLDYLLSQGKPLPHFLSDAMGLEKMVNHPLASAIIEYCNVLNIQPTVFDSCENIPGQGVIYRADKSLLAIGSLRLMEQLNVEIPSMAETSPGAKVYMCQNSTLIAVFHISDTIRSDSIQAISDLHKRGLQVYMVTGDNRASGEYIGKQVGVDKVYADVLPANKEKILSDLIKSGKRVAMIGDGINDSPALSSATVGVAIGGGADIAVESADLVLMHSKIGDFVKAYDLSGHTLHAIRRGLFWALIYNSVCIPLAAGVLYIPLGISLNPMIAAGAMSFSSVSVVLNALSLKWTHRKNKITP